MDGYFFYNRETGIGQFVSAKEMQDGMCAIAVLAGAYAIVGMVCLVLALLIASPFLTLFAFEYLFSNIIGNNVLFFVALGAGLVLLRLFGGKGSRSLIVRIVFFAYVLILALYPLIQWLRMDVGIYTFFGFFQTYLPESAFGQVLSADKINAAAGDQWFYRCFLQFCDFFVGGTKWMLGQLMSLDHSAYTAELANVDILAFLKTVLFDVAIGGLGLIAVIVGAVLLIAVITVSILLPYAIAVLAVVLVNKGIYQFRSLQTKKIAPVGDEYTADPLLQAANQKWNENTPEAKKEAVKLYLQAAKKGNPYGQCLYAECAMAGEGMLKNPKEAFVYYKKAASQGLCNAMFMTAVNYYDGHGTYKDRALARAWMVAALRHKEFFAHVQKTPNLKNAADIVMKKSRFSQYF